MIEAEERAATPWGQLARQSQRWPLRVVCGISAALVILGLPLGGGISFAIRPIFIASSWMFELGGMYLLLHMRLEMIDITPGWLRRLAVLMGYGIKGSGILLTPTLMLVPAVLAFPSLRATPLAPWVVALFFVGLVPVGLMALLCALMIVSLPVAIIFGIRNTIRRRRGRRWYLRNEYSPLQSSLALEPTHPADDAATP